MSFTPTTNLQIVPFTGDAPAGAKVVMLPAREGDNIEPQPCPRCEGTGKLPRFGDSCRACGGTGKGKFVRALRWDFDGERDRETISALVRGAVARSARHQFTIQLAETGGGLTNTGRATIVAGLNGEKLPAVYGVPKCGEPHAVFYVHAALVIHYCQHRGVGSGTVELIALTGREWGHGYRPQITTVWRFADGDEGIEVVDEQTASGLVFPAEAVEAARHKAQAYHCRSAYYAAAGGACGPSGALTGAGAACGGLPSPAKSGGGIGYTPTEL